MNPRLRAMELAGERRSTAARSEVSSTEAKIASERFGMYVFGRSQMQKLLPTAVYKNLLNASEGREKINPDYADAIAVAMKEWAVNLGASHFCHWFLPLTGASAEKHDAFIEWHTPGQVIERFSGKQLIRGEPDASSFPSGGLRSTFEARGYTWWDPTSPVFVWMAGDGVTLFIPSLFCSWTGDVLDTRIPLHRSEQKLNQEVLRLLQLTGIKADFVYPTLGLEQEYFVIDRALRDLRPDLLLCGRTVFGAPSPKGQELQDHYFAPVRDRILTFMNEFETRALQLGIPLKTRHNEVAPAQHEVAPVYERASRAIDQNILLMELMRRTARQQGLACLLHEKPFAELNGSGKHANWSISTDTGINLFDPTDTPENNLHFLVLLTAVIHGVYRHAKLLRASVGSASNDLRLGGHEAPPAIMSVYLGDALEKLLNNLEASGAHQSPKEKSQLDLGISVLSSLPKDDTDRNRTSPFAFTGNKFEFRAVGSSANAAMPITVLNTAVAETLSEIMDEVERSLATQKAKKNQTLLSVMVPVLRQYLKASKPVRFSGDNYSAAWVKEAARRGLPNLHKSVEAFDALVSQETIRAFTGILTPLELASRREIALDTYVFQVQTEAKLMVELFKTIVFPIALRYQHELSQTIASAHEAKVSKLHLDAQLKTLKEVNALVEKGSQLTQNLAQISETAAKGTLEARAKCCAEQVSAAGEELRECVDQLETIVADPLWPWPKYRELLFMV